MRKSKWKCASESLKDPLIRNYTVKKLLTWISQEIKCLCSYKVNSLLRDTDVTGFTWDAVIAELKSHAPLFLAFMQACMHTRKPRKNYNAVLGVCTAILLKHRCKEMNLVQKVLSLVLYIGNARKQVFIFDFSFDGVGTKHIYFSLGFSAVTEGQLDDVTCFCCTFVDHIW